LEIHVKDDGVGLPYGWDIENDNGLGVRVTHERLTGLYPEIANPFVIRNRASGGVEVIMRIPLRNARDNEHGTATV
jgi:LytS/YehU family sensor histidine kinase